MHKQQLIKFLIASAFWAGILPGSWGYAQTCSERIAHLSYGINMKGNVWVPEGWVPEITGRKRGAFLHVPRAQGSG